MSGIFGGTILLVANTQFKHNKEPTTAGSRRMKIGYFLVGCFIPDARGPSRLISCDGILRKLLMGYYCSIIFKKERFVIVAGFAKPETGINFPCWIILTVHPVALDVLCSADYLHCQPIRLSCVFSTCLFVSTQTTSWTLLVLEVIIAWLFPVLDIFFNSAICMEVLVLNLSLV